MTRPALTTEGAAAVYALLRLIGAPKGSAVSFVMAFTTSPVPREWRFQGEFGFGGKFWLGSERWCVTCYHEDETPEIREKISLVNPLLEHLRQRFGGGDSFEKAQESAQKGLQFASSPCRFCAQTNEVGQARCSACDRTLWQGRSTLQCYLGLARQKDEAAELEFDRLIELSRSSGDDVTATWTSNLERAGYTRASAWDVEGKYKIAFAGPGWAIHLKQ